MSITKPMKPATKSVTEEQLLDLLPLWASPKLDGIRSIIQESTALSNSLKPIRNPFIQSILGDSQLNGLDGEIIIGSPTASDVYRITNGGVMRGHGEPDFQFYVFDNYLIHGGYTHRTDISLRFEHPYIKWVNAVLCTTVQEVLDMETTVLNAGYEGLILRKGEAPYKHGRATLTSGWMLKLKRFMDAEAIIIGMEELMHNGNEKVTNELGRGQRSSHKENKIPLNSMGALICRDLKSGIEFNIGTGFSAKERQDIWNDRTNHIGNGVIIKYKSFKIGVKDKPRHPVFLGFRDKDDL